MDYSANPNAIPFLMQFPEKIDWILSSSNPNAIPLLEQNLEYDKLELVVLESKCDSSLGTTSRKNRLVLVSANPNAIPLLERNPEK